MLLVLLCQLKGTRLEFSYYGIDQFIGNSVFVIANITQATCSSIGVQKGGVGGVFWSGTVNSQ